MTPPITAPYDTINFTETVLSIPTLSVVLSPSISMEEQADIVPTYTIVPKVVIPLDETTEVVQAVTEEGLNVDDYTISAIGMWDFVLFQGRWSYTFENTWDGNTFSGEVQPPLPSG